MVSAVMGRAVGLGALAGALSGPVAVVAFFASAALDTNPDPFRTGSGASVLGAIGGILSYGVLAALVGSAAGALLGGVVGLPLSTLHPRLTGRPLRSRVAAGAACALTLVLLAAALLAIGTGKDFIALLCGPPLVVATAIAAWRGPSLIDGRPPDARHKRG